MTSAFMRSPLKRGDHGLRHVARTRAAAEVWREDFLRRYPFDRLHDARRRARLAEMLEHERAGPERRDRVGDAFAGDVERRAVDRLEHRRELALRIEIRGRRNAERAGQGGGQVRENVRVEV